MPAQPKLNDEQRQAIIDLKAAEPDIPNREIPIRLDLDVTHTTVQSVLKKAREAGAPTPAGPAGHVAILHDRLTPCPLNPRKTFTEDALRTLAHSLRTFGGGPLQNIVARPTPGQPGRYEILAGERRWRAFGINIAEGHTPADMPMPCKIIEADDEQALLIALSENDERENVPPMEQAEGYAKLRDIRRARNPDMTDRQFILELAEQIGRSDAYVRIRLHWIDKLCPPAQALLRDGHLSMEAARVLVMADHDMQAEALAQIEDGHIFDAEDLRGFITQDVPSFAWAAFDRAAYTGGIMEDPENPENGWFTDVPQAMRLQREAIDALTDRLKAERDWVEVIGMTGFYSPHYYRPHQNDAGDEAERGAVIDISRGLGVTVHDDLARKPSHPACDNTPVPDENTDTETDGANGVRTEDDPQAPVDPKTPQPSLTPVDAARRAHYVHARGRKSKALQRRVAQDDKAAMALACLALMGHQSCCRIMPTDIHRDDTALATEVRDGLENWRKLLSPGNPGSGAAFSPPDPDDRTPLMLAARGWGQDTADNPGAAQLLRDLLSTKMADLDTLFRLLVARQVGSFCDGDAGPGDFATVRTLAHHLGMDNGREADHGLRLEWADLEGLRGPALKATAWGLGIEPGKTAAATRTLIMDEFAGLPFHDDYVLPTLRFTDPDTALAELTGQAATKDQTDD